MIVKYFNDLESLADSVCSELKGMWRKYGCVHVGRVFSLKRCSCGVLELTEWDWRAVPYCSKVRERLLLRIRKPLLAFVRVPSAKDDKVVFYVYYNMCFFGEEEVKETINEFNNMINSNLWVIEMRSS
jgi:hypothetical protein